jgi:hypothetical protein
MRMTEEGIFEIYCTFVPEFESAYFHGLILHPSILCAHLHLSPPNSFLYFFFSSSMIIFYLHSLYSGNKYFCFSIIRNLKAVIVDPYFAHQICVHIVNLFGSNFAAYIIVLEQ